MAINWDDMGFFLALYRKKSFLSAASELKVTHSTVARRISALEESLQTQLFHRTEKGCCLTPAGENMIPFAEQLESMVIKMEEEISGYNNQLSGAIRIGAPDGIGNSYLASCLGILQATHQALDVELIAVPMYYSLSKREIDILITVKKPKVGNIVSRKLTPYMLGMFATREYLVNRPEIRTREDLKKHAFVGYIDDLLFDQDLRFMDEISKGLNVKFRSSTVVAQANAVASGVGIGVIPYFMAHKIENLIPVLPELNIERGYWLQVNPDSRQLARVRTTIDFIVGQVETDKHLFVSLQRKRLADLSKLEVTTARNF
jgi:DNA-binding transcriptional LysR family regulator